PRRCGHAHCMLGWVLGSSGLDRRHIAFNPVTSTSDTTTRAALELAPTAVLPAYQHRGIGSQLVEAGLSACYPPLWRRSGAGTSSLLSSVWVCTSQTIGHCVGT